MSCVSLSRPSAGENRKQLFRVVLRAVSTTKVSALVLGGLAGLGAGNLSLRFLFSPRRNGSSGAVNPHAEADRSYDTPPPAVLRRSVLAVATASAVALAAGGPPAALTEISRPLVAGALAAVLFVAVCGGLWGCTRGAEGAASGARGAYGKVASDDREAHEVELRPFVGGGAEGDGDSDDDDGCGRGDDDYLDEEDGYLADEGETERAVGDGGRGGVGVGKRVQFSTLPPAKSSSSPPPPRGGEGGGGGGAHQAAGSRGAAAVGAAGGKKETRPKAAPPAKPLFSVGHTVEL